MAIPSGIWPIPLQHEDRRSAPKAPQPAIWAPRYYLTEHPIWAPGRVVSRGLKPSTFGGELVCYDVHDYSADGVVVDVAEWRVRENASTGLALGELGGEENMKAMLTCVICADAVFEKARLGIKSGAKC